MRLIIAALPLNVRAVLLDDRTCVIDARQDAPRAFLLTHADMLRAASVTMAVAFGVKSVVP